MRRVLRSLFSCYSRASMTTRLAIALILATTAFAADPALTGRVLDPQGKAVAGARLRLQSGDSTVASTTSDAQGQYRIATAIPGSYRLSVEAPGFQTARESVTLPAELDITLSGIAGQHDSVVIS